MSNPKQTYRDELLRIQDALADSLERATDKEILEDMQARGLDPAKQSERFQQILERATHTAGKLRLKAAQEALQQGRVAQRSLKVVDMAQARAQLKLLVSKDPSFGGGFMLAARNAGAKGIDELTDNDVLAMREMAIELRRIPTDEPE